MLTNERTNLSDKTLVCLQRMKEYCRAFGVAHNNTFIKDILQVTQNAHIKYKKCKAQDEEKMRMKEEKEKRQIE